MNQTDLTIGDEVKMADYYDDTFLLFRILDFISVAKWQLLYNPVLCWYVWKTNTNKLRTYSLKRKVRRAEFIEKVYNNG